MIAHARRIGWIVFWVAAVILGLLVVPVMRNPSAIPMMVFAIIVLAVGSALWGTGMIGRQTAVWGATIVLVLSIMSFFLPMTAKRVPETVKSFDAWLATPATATTSGTAGSATIPPATATTVVVQKVGMTPVLYRFSDYRNGCVSLKLGYQVRWYPKGGAMRVWDPARHSHIDRPGVDVPLSKFDPGDWEFCREDPGAIGVEVWQ